MGERLYRKVPGLIPPPAWFVKKQAVLQLLMVSAFLVYSKSCTAVIGFVVVWSKIFGKIGYLARVDTAEL